MSALTLSTFESEMFQPLRTMHPNAQDSGVFGTPPYRRCNSSIDVTKRKMPLLSEGRKKPRFSDSACLPDDLISLSYDLITHIQRHEIHNDADICLANNILSSAARDESSLKNRSMIETASADSSLPYDFDKASDKHMMDEMSDEVTTLSTVSSLESTFPDYQSVDSSRPGGKATSTSNGKPLYTAELCVLCRICGDKASGFHYGVHSCEGCKGFFRRTLKKKLVYKPCKEGAKCRIDTETRNKCQCCRYQKCINAGMSPDAVRFGRMPKSEREKLIADKEELTSSNSDRILELRTLSDSIKCAFPDSFSKCSFICNYFSKKQPGAVKVEPDVQFCVDTLNNEQFIDRNIYKSFQAAIIPIIEGTVKFTKKIPKFSNLDMADRIALLKHNCYNVSLILCFMMYDHNSIFLGTNETYISLTSSNGHYSCFEVKCLFEGLFFTAKKLKKLTLTHVEVALFCAIVLLNEAPKISDPAAVECLQLELVDSLRLELKHNHPKDRHMLPYMLLLIPSFVQFSDELRCHMKDHLFDATDHFTETHELFCEIFDLH